MSLIDRKANPKWDEKMQRYNDWDLWMTLEAKGHKGVFLDKVILHTKNRPTGISSQNDSEEALEKLRKKHNIDRKRKLADIIIPHHNRHDLLKECLERLDNSLFNIIVVSGGSFAENCNKGAKIATTDNLIFLNDDTHPDNSILEEMVNSDGDITGVAQVIPKHGVNRILYGIYYWRDKDLLHAGLSHSPKETHIPSGYCFKVKKRVWKKMKGLNEEYRNGAEDQDFGFRAIRDGYKIDYVLKPMVHLESQSEGRFMHARINHKILDKAWPKEKLIKLLKL